MSRQKGSEAVAFTIAPDDVPNWKRRKARYCYQCKLCKQDKSIVAGESRKADGTLVIHVAGAEELAYYQRGRGMKICPGCYEKAVQEGQKNGF